MNSVALIVLLAAAQSSAASLSVGATVVRPEPQPVVAVSGGAVSIRNAGAATVTAEGGTLRSASDGTILVAPGSADRIVVTLTY